MVAQKSVQIYNAVTGMAVGTYPSVNEAAKRMGIPRSKVRRLAGTGIPNKGRFWTYNKLVHTAQKPNMSKPYNPSMPKLNRAQLAWARRWANSMIVNRPPKVITPAFKTPLAFKTPFAIKTPVMKTPAIKKPMTKRPSTKNNIRAARTLMSWTAARPALARRRTAKRARNNRITPKNQNSAAQTILAWTAARRK